MIRVPEPPDGFLAESRGPVTLIVKSALREAIEGSGLDRPEGWRVRTDGRGGPAGRGSTAIVRLHGGPGVRIKQLRRGGAVASLWHDRFPGARRLMDNLRLPIAAAHRGVPTPLPVALLLLEGPPGLCRGWLGVEEIDDATDLATRFSSRRPPTLDELDCVSRTVRRMHDAGLDHRDLNLGNLMVREGAAADPRVFVIDLDGSRLLDRPLGFRARQRALRRLERSYVKLCAPMTAAEEVRDGLYRSYAGEDRRLAMRLARGRRAGRGWISLHRLGWRR